MGNWKIHLRNTLISGLGFGFGFLIGNFCALLIFDSGLLDLLPSLFEPGRLFLGVALNLLVFGLAGAIAGAIGGLALSYATPSANRIRYAWSSALAFGVGYALIFAPLTFAISIIAVEEMAEASPVGLMLPLGIMGAIFGAVSGIILGILTVRRQAWRVFLVGSVSFIVAGWEFGYALWHYFFGGEEFREAAWLPHTGIVLFGVIGGGALGFLYSWLARRKPRPWLVPRLAGWYKRSTIIPRLIAVIVAILIFLVLRGLWLISPFNSQAAPLATKLESRTTGTHWSLPASLVADVELTASAPALFAAETGHLAVAWAQATDSGTDVYYATRSGVGASWSTPVNVSNSRTTVSSESQLVTDSQSNVHIVWTEATNAGSDASEIFYSRCADSTCTPPLTLSNLADLACESTLSTQNSRPAIAIDRADILMVTWQNGQQTLPFSTWSATDTPPDTPSGCVPAGDLSSETTVQQPRLAGGSEASFSLAFERLNAGQGGEIYLSQYTNDGWDSAPVLIGQGQFPEIFADPEEQIHLAWCGPAGQLSYWSSTGQSSEIAFPTCSGRPALSQDSNGLPRLIWYADEVENVGGVVNPNQLIYESVKTEAGWTEPTIISQTNGPIQPTLAAAGDGTLHLAWAEQKNLYYASHTEYDCTDAELTDIGQVIFDVVRQEKYRPASDPVPFCHNQYDRLVYAPNPDPAFSNKTPTQNGAFDQYVELARTAEYEVVYSTMWYEADKNQDSPGRVLAGVVAELYQNLQADPARYPRGLTVRIALGNPPSFALFPTFNNQVRLVMEDLRSAGVPEMSNPELGWKVEVANFKGFWPHGHTKMMVVDGKTVIGAGYNLQYAHYAKEHPSGRGKDKVDLGLQITGPVAQAALRAFDDLWQASTKIHCADLNPNSSFLWMFSCRNEPAIAEHVPEVLQYYLPETDSNAFSLHRTDEFRESDEAFYQAMASAQSSIDMIQVNFSLEIICNLGLFHDICNFSNRIEPLDAFMAAVETNQVKVRILVKEPPIEGFENKIAINALQNEVAAKGVSELVEIRYFNDKEVHPKVVLIDQELLVVGSQNFHYSAWGDQALTEYNLTTDDPAAVQEFQRFFDYHWERGKPVE